MEKLNYRIAEWTGWAMGRVLSWINYIDEDARASNLEDWKNRDIQRHELADAVAHLEAENARLRKKHHPDCNIFITGPLDMPEPIWCTCGYGQLEAENARLQEWIDLFDTHRLEGMFGHYMEMQKQAVHGQRGESTVKFWHERAKSQREIIEAHIALTKEK